jgi:hypothetical protein
VVALALFSVILPQMSLAQLSTQEMTIFDQILAFMQHGGGWSGHFWVLGHLVTLVY